MSYKPCLLIFLAFAVTAQKYDLEQRCNKLFGKGLSQVLQEFRDSPEYLKILAQKISNWKNSANMILISLLEDQTIKFFKDVKNFNNVEIPINTRQNMKKKQNIFELLDEHSYAQLTSDEVSKIKNLAHQHFNMFLHSYMEALSPGSSNSSRDSLRSKHEPQFLEKGKRLVLDKSQMTKIEVPKIPKHEMPRMQEIQSVYRQKELKKPAEIPKPDSPKIPRMKQKERLPEKKVPKEPEIPKLEVQKLPKQEMTRIERLYEQKVLKKPETPKLEVPKINISKMQQKERLPEQKVIEKSEMPKLEVPKQEMPRMERLYGQKLPKEVEKPKLEVPNVPEMLKNKLQKQDGVSKQEFLRN